MTIQVLLKWITRIHLPSSPQVAFSGIWSISSVSDVCAWSQLTISLQTRFPYSYNSSVYANLNVAIIDSDAVNPWDCRVWTFITCTQHDRDMSFCAGKSGATRTQDAQQFRGSTWRYDEVTSFILDSISYTVFVFYGNGSEQRGSNVVEFSGSQFTFIIIHTVQFVLQHMPTLLWSHGMPFQPRRRLVVCVNETPSLADVPVNWRHSGENTHTRTHTLTKTKGAIWKINIWKVMLAYYTYRSTCTGSCYRYSKCQNK